MGLKGSLEALGQGGWVEQHCGHSHLLPPVSASQLLNGSPGHPQLALIPSAVNGVVGSVTVSWGNGLFLWLGTRAVPRHGPSTHKPKSYPSTLLLPLLEGTGLFQSTLTWETSVPAEVPSPASTSPRQWHNSGPWVAEGSGDSRHEEGAPMGADGLFPIRKWKATLKMSQWDTRLDLSAALGLPGPINRACAWGQAIRNVNVAMLTWTKLVKN